MFDQSTFKDKMAMLERRHEELGSLLGTPAVINNRAEFLKFSREHAELDLLVPAWKEYSKLVKNLVQAKQMVDAEPDPELREMARDEMKELDQQKVVASDGGLARAPEIRAQLLQSFHGRETGGSSSVELLRRGVSAVFALALVLVAVGLHLGRRRFGYTEPPLDVRLGSSAFDRWRRILVPGVAAAEVGEGGRTFLALLLPAGLLMLPLSGDVGYRIPWGYDPGNVILWTFAVLGLLLYFGARLRWELTHQV